MPSSVDCSGLAGCLRREGKVQTPIMSLEPLPLRESTPIYISRARARLEHLAFRAHRSPCHSGDCSVQELGPKVDTLPFHIYQQASLVGVSEILKQSSSVFSFLRCLAVSRPGDLLKLGGLSIGKGECMVLFGCICGSRTVLTSHTTWTAGRSRTTSRGWFSLERLYVCRPGSHETCIELGSSCV